MAYNYGVKGILGAYGIVCMLRKFRAQQILGLRGKSKQNTESEYMGQTSSSTPLPKT